MPPTSGRSRLFLPRTYVLTIVSAVIAAACAPTLVPLSTTSAPAAAPIDSSSDVAAAPIATTTDAPFSPAAVRDTIDQLLAQPAFRTAFWSALVLGERGDTLYVRHPETLLIPASNMKIVTAAVALAQLGPDYQFADTALTLAAGDTVPADFGPMYDTLYLRDHPLRDVMSKMLKPSQNRLAEQIARTVALEKTGSSSRDSAVAVTGRQLAAWGIPADGYILYDGSGYDRANYLSVETITRILWQLRSDSAFTVFYDALPIAGVDGTLRTRMRATAAEHNAHAKTGSLRSIRALSGYVTTAGGEQLTFSFVCNAYTVTPERVLRIMDRAVALLAQLPARAP